MAAAPVGAAIVVTQTDKGFVFAEAVSINVPTEVRLSLLLVRIRSLKILFTSYPSIKLGEALYRDSATCYWALSSEVL